MTEFETAKKDVANLPPIVPLNEETAGDEMAFVSECYRRLGDTTGWNMGNTLLTRTERWGLLWRADFNEKSSEPGTISRVICWDEPGSGRQFVMFARDRNIPPL